MSLCASVYMCFVVTCWERADLLAIVCGVCCEFVTFPLVSWVRCGTWLYRFLIFAPLLTCWPWVQGHTKQRPVSSTSYDLCIYKVWSCYDLENIQLQETRNVTNGMTDGQTDRRTTDRLWYEINIPYFSNEKAGIIIGDIIAFFTDNLLSTQTAVA